jgi:ketosteroid isomerase-like protein
MWKKGEIVLETQEFSQANREFVRAINQKAVEGLGSVYAIDAKLLPPNSEMLEGLENIRQFWRGAIDAGVHDIAIDTLDLILKGDTAYEVGKYSLKIKTDKGELTEDDGKFVVIWKLQQDNCWKWQVDIWNSNHQVN